MPSAIYIGCAGWNIGREHAPKFAAEGSHLQRYSQRFDCVEINSSFYRSHRLATYQRWAAETPPGFRFAVKIPKQITHIKRLVGVESEIAQFAAETAGLGDKRGAVLVQLPPSLSFEPKVAESFFDSLRSHVDGALVCEPRHLTWFSPEADLLLQSHGIGRVAADPSIGTFAAIPGGCVQLVYFRWHGSPRIYYSAYDDTALRALKLQLTGAALGAETAWCIFDNTAEGAALANALELIAML